MKRTLALTLLTIALWTCSGMCHAAQAAQPSQLRSGEMTFSWGIGYLNGNTLYHISSYDTAGNGVESELEFPLNTILLGLEGGYVGRNRKGQDAFRIGLQWSINLDSGSGKLKDSDWLTDPLDISLVGSAHPGLDIYSTSDITLKANIVDIRASYNFWPSDSLGIGPLGGFLYQNFRFDASNVNQVGYGPYATDYTRSVSGRVLTYEATFSIPYAGIHTEMLLRKQFQMTVDLGYSPLAGAEDKDDHIRRGKVSKARTSGWAYLAALTAQWDIEDNDWFLIRGQYLKIGTTGTQTQTWYRDEIISTTETVPAGTTVTGIDDRITSRQISATVLFSHRF